MLYPDKLTIYAKDSGPVQFLIFPFWVFIACGSSCAVSTVFFKKMYLQRLDGWQA